jgi:superfamily II DNA/RNA helicase
MEQSDRIAEFDRFKKDEINILVASDVAARGLDVKGVSHVVQFRMSRGSPTITSTALAAPAGPGWTGIAITLANHRRWRGRSGIEKLIGP